MTASADPVSTADPGPGERQSGTSLIDLHLVWERQLATLLSIDLAAVDEATFLAVCERIEHLERLILRTRARTLAGAMTQVRRVAASMAERSDERERRALRLVLATLARLHDVRCATGSGSAAVTRRAPT
jgi:hypothetical protein